MWAKNADNQSKNACLFVCLFACLFEFAFVLRTVKKTSLHATENVSLTRGETVPQRMNPYLQWPRGHMHYCVETKAMSNETDSKPRVLKIRQIRLSEISCDDYEWQGSLPPGRI
jgi:hypothetical protein